MPSWAEPALTNAEAISTIDSVDTDTEPQETFGTHALDLTLATFNELRQESETFTLNIAALPQLSSWIELQTTDPRLQNRWNAIGTDCLTIIGLSLLAAVTLELLLFPVRRSLYHREPQSMMKRSATVLGLVGLKLIPILVFVGTALTLLDQNETQKIPRFVILSMINAITLNGLILTVIHALFVPKAPALRFVPATTPQAVYAQRWLSLFSVVIIYGYFLIDVARGLHVPATLISACLNLLGLTLVIMAIITIIQKRGFVANLLRGNLSAARTDLSFIDSLRLWFARSWHVLAIAYLTIGYSITAMGVENGFNIMLRGTILSLLIIISLRLMLRATSRRIHSALFRPLLQMILWVAAATIIAMAWGANISELFTLPLGQRILGGAFSIGATTVLLTLLYELFSAAAEKHLNRKDADGTIQVSSRARTLLPMMRTTAFVVFAAIIGMVVLSEVGVNIGPLLAGAGVLGVAVGFGSQTLVKDFLTGLFIIVENTIAVGDTVKIADHAGTVEAMSMRTIRLRDDAGGLHILPYSEVSKIVNMSKDFSYAQISASVGYSSNLDRVITVLHSIDEGLRKEPAFKQMALDPIQILGVDNLGDFAITLLARIRTRPGKQQDVRRMFLLKMKQRFDAEGIEIPFPTAISIQRKAPPDASS